jgi:hypothetical protein
MLRPMPLTRLSYWIPTWITVVSLLQSAATATTVDILNHYAEGNRVTLKVDVLDQNNIPVDGLQEPNFKVDTTDRQGNPITDRIPLRLIPRGDASPDPVYIAILLDMSGSMKHQDASGAVKLQVATQAIERFIEQIRLNRIPAQIALVPFGYGGDNSCSHLFTVNAQTIAKDAPFQPASNDALKTNLNQLAQVPVCASTNLKIPLEAATQHLRQEVQKQALDSQGQPPPRQMIILLSDGYDDSTPGDVAELKAAFQQAPPITVHTLGYGESLQDLRDRASCSVFIPDDTLTPQNLENYCQLSNADIREFLIDEAKLQELATATGGIYQLSQNPTEVSQSLTNFLATLRQYELVYAQPDADRATRHQTRVEVTDAARQIQAISEPQEVMMKNFAYKSLSFLERMLILGSSIALGFGGSYWFYQWSRQLKKQAERL